MKEEENCHGPICSEIVIVVRKLKPDIGTVGPDSFSSVNTRLQQYS